MNQLRVALFEKRFATIIIFAFLAVYALAAYLLVSAGLSYVQKLPLIGVVLIERMLYLLYFFFFCDARAFKCNDYRYRAISKTRN